MNFCLAFLITILSMLCPDNNLETCIQCCLGPPADAPSHSNICHSQQVHFLIRSICCHCLQLIHCCSEVWPEPQLSIIIFADCLPIFTSLSEILAVLVICELPVEVALLNFQSYTGRRPEVDTQTSFHSVGKWSTEWAVGWPLNLTCTKKNHSDLICDRNLKILTNSQFWLICLNLSCICTAPIFTSKCFHHHHVFFHFLKINSTLNSQKKCSIVPLYIKWNLSFWP